MVGERQYNIKSDISHSSNDNKGFNYNSSKHTGLIYQLLFLEDEIYK